MATIRKPFEVYSHPGQEAGGPSRTKQSMKDECDVNRIIQTFEKTGVITHTNPREGHYLDCTAMTGYREAIHHVRNAETIFRALPSEVREDFGNDPASFLDFASNPENRDELVRLGLAEPLGDHRGSPKDPDKAPKRPKAPGEDSGKDPEPVDPENKGSGK